MGDVDVVLPLAVTVFGSVGWRASQTSNIAPPTPLSPQFTAYPTINQLRDIHTVPGSSLSRPRSPSGYLARTANQRTRNALILATSSSFGDRPVIRLLTKHPSDRNVAVLPSGDRVWRFRRPDQSAATLIPNYNIQDHVTFPCSEQWRCTVVIAQIFSVFEVWLGLCASSSPSGLLPLQEAAYL